MVKAEAEKDYYADLEINPSADANDVKKAFMRLGTGCWALVKAMPLYTALLASYCMSWPICFHSSILFSAVDSVQIHADIVCL